MTRLEEIRQLLAFDDWAREHILAAVAALPPEQFTKEMGSSFPSIRDTLVHVMSADWVWLERWAGTSPTAMPEGWRASDMAQLRARWTDVVARRSAFVTSLRESDLDRVVEYRNLAGIPSASTLAQMLRHVVNHATYHRGQVTTMLRQLGATPPATDLIAFYRLLPIDSAPPTTP